MKEGVKSVAEHIRECRIYYQVFVITGELSSTDNIVG